ncbi:MAG TPA: hypothetical protein VJ754_08670 [Anaerolineae bacterium]|nr:MAG: hypothetical protein A2W37_11100 [Chloroflexi bacterium RBG_16_63_12]HJW84366.1 hypothetical protein [Anaerolineae bacterium]
MKMHLTLVRSLIVLAALTLAPVGIALAHGVPVIAVQPAVVAAGDQITVTGTEMEPGEVFTITLEGVSGSIPLGEAAVTGEGEEGGFTATFTIPADTAPGSYTVRAATEEGESAEADLTVTAPSAEASAGPAMAEEPTGEQHLLDRSKPIGQIAAVVVVIALSAAAGFVLVRSRG